MKDVNLEEYREALVSCEEKLKMLPAEHPDTASFLNDLGIEYYVLGDHEKAKECFERALAIRVKVLPAEHPDTASSFNNLGNTYYNLGDYEKAKKYHERALTMQEKILPAEHPDIAGSFNGLGNTYYALGDYEKAKEYHERALAIRVKVLPAEHSDTAHSFNDLGNTYYALGDYEKAKKCFERALTMQEKILPAGHPDTASSFSNLGNTYGTLGDYEKAKKYHERALEIQEKVLPAGHPDTASSFSNLGSIYNALGDYEKAKECFERALMMQEKILPAEHPNIAHCFSNLGNTCRALGDYEKAKEYHERALAIREKILPAEHPDTASSFNNLGNTYYALGDYETAKEYHECALEIRVKILGEGHPDTAASLHNLGGYYAIIRLEDLAIAYKKMAVNIIQSTRVNMTGLDKDLQKSYLHSNEIYYRSLIDLLIEQGRIVEAQQVLAVQKEEEFYDFTRRNKTSDPRVTRASYSPFEQVQIDLFLKSSRELFKMGKEKEELLQRKKILLPSEWESSGDAKRFVEINEACGKAIVEFRQTLIKIEEKAKNDSNDDRRRQIAQMRLDFFENFRERLREIGHGAVLLHTVITSEHLWLILTTPKVQYAFKSQISQRELYQKIFTFRENLNRPTSDIEGVKYVAKELYDILIAPVSKALQDSNAQTLIFSLDGALRYIPVSALFDGTKWLIEKYAVVNYTEVAGGGLRNSTMERNLDIAAFGVSKAHPPFPALPEVEKELNSILSLPDITGVIQLNEEFTQETFTQALNAERPMPMVHLASHFMFNPGTIDDSFLLLGDGKHLTLKAIDTGAIAFGSVDMLTLSACDTAMVAEERAGREVEGFGVLAQKRGAKTIIATLWKVADVSTRDFMSTFYTNLKESGITKAEALRRTQLTFIEYAGFSHPFYWAPFILMGNWL
jgi:CHAT domain-containing protein/tetratricopeptide (TPR) repeat protein